MDRKRRQALEAKGFKVGTIAELLDFTPEEEAMMEIHTSLTVLLRHTRESRGLTQTQAARMIDSGQAVFARAENNSSTVGLDYYVKALLALGLTRQQIGRAISVKSLPELQEPKRGRPVGARDAVKRGRRGIGAEA